MGLLFRLFNQGAAGGLTLADAIVGDDVLQNIWSLLVNKLFLRYYGTAMYLFVFAYQTSKVQSEDSLLPMSSLATMFCRLYDLSRPIYYWLQLLVSGSALLLFCIFEILSIPCPWLKVTLPVWPPYHLKGHMITSSIIWALVYTKGKQVLTTWIEVEGKQCAGLVANS